MNLEDAIQQGLDTLLTGHQLWAVSFHKNFHPGYQVNFHWNPDGTINDFREDSKCTQGHGNTVLAAVQDAVYQMKERRYGKAE